jgi:hypothetical protein
MKRTDLVHRSPTRLIALACALFLVCLAVVSVPKASAYFPKCGEGELRRQWYSDAEHTTLVGTYIYYCDCTYSRWGTQSGYLVEQLLPCP